jgi:hypothetical protein
MRRSISTTILAGLATVTVVASNLAAQISGGEIGGPAPSFTLPDTYDEEHSLSDYRGEWVVLEWLNYECPFVRKHYDSGNMQRLQQAYAEKGVKWFAVVSSAPGKQGYHEPDELNRLSQAKGSKVAAVLLDPEGTVGKLYGAQTTPQMYVISPAGILLYNGAIDDKPSARLESLEGAHNYLAAALDEAMNGRPVTTPTSKPYGCSVKYQE